MIDKIMKITPPGFCSGKISTILRLEGLLVLALASYIYNIIPDKSWKLFAYCFFVPDISLVGYLIGKQTGAVFYNIMHSYILPLSLLIMSYQWPCHLMQAISIIWIAHIGFDRALGYGLKYADGFGYTHLGLIGKLKQKPQA